jgi:membrane-associated phospholipid phosphatase
MRTRPAQPLLAASVRPWAAGLLAFCVFLIAALGALFAHQSRPDWLDQAIDSRVTYALGGHNVLLHFLAAPATLIPAGLTSLIMVVVCLLTGRLKGAVLAATAVPAASTLCDALLKPLVHRTDLGSVTYPSGHVTSILALTTMLTVLLVMPPQPLIGRRARLLIPVAGGEIACGVAIAVIGLRWHYFTDTIGGAALGTGTVCALALILDAPAVSRLLESAGDWLDQYQRSPVRVGDHTRRAHAARQGP